MTSIWVPEMRELAQKGTIMHSGLARDVTGAKEALAHRLSRRHDELSRSEARKHVNRAVAAGEFKE